MYGPYFLPWLRYGTILEVKSLTVKNWYLCLHSCWQWPCILCCSSSTFGMPISASSFSIPNSEKMKSLPHAHTSGCRLRTKNRRQLRSWLCHSCQSLLRYLQANCRQCIALKSWRKECSGLMKQRHSEVFHTRSRILLASINKQLGSKIRMNRKRHILSGVTMWWRFQSQASSTSIRSMWWRHSLCFNCSAHCFGFSMSIGIIVYSTWVCSSFSKEQSSCKDYRTCRDWEAWESQLKRFGFTESTSGKRFRHLIYILVMLC